MISIAVERLKLAGFRCWERASFAFPEPKIAVVGGNGTGKTSLFEGICMLTRGRSFRRGGVADWVREGAEVALLSGRFRRFGPVEVSVRASRRGIELRVQGVRARARLEVMRMLPVVVDSPQGLRIVDGEIKERRRWLDGLWLGVDPTAEEIRRRAMRAWLQRARAVRERRAQAEVEAWEEAFVEDAARWAKVRLELVARLNQALEKLVDGKVRLEAEPPPEREAWLRLLAENRDALRGWAVHTAAVKLFWRGKEARVHASRGQQRLCAIALRMAECAVVAERLGCFPILLLDDALEAMDSRYQSYVLAWLEAYPGQAMISAPSLPSGFTGAVIRMEE